MAHSGPLGDEQLLHRSVPDRLAHGLGSLDEEPPSAFAVPLHGPAESLNLASAAAVCLYASARAHRRRAAPDRDHLGSGEN